MHQVTLVAALLAGACACAQSEYLCRVTATAPTMDGVLGIRWAAGHRQIGTYRQEEGAGEVPLEPG